MASRASPDGGPSRPRRCSRDSIISSPFRKTRADSVFRSAARLCLVESLAAHRQEALLYRRLATLRDDVPLAEELADLEWRGAGAAFEEVCRELGDEELPRRLAQRRDA